MTKAQVEKMAQEARIAIDVEVSDIECINNFDIMDALDDAKRACQVRTNNYDNVCIVVRAENGIALFKPVFIRLKGGD